MIKENNDLFTFTFHLQQAKRDAPINRYTPFCLIKTSPITENLYLYNKICQSKINLLHQLLATQNSHNAGNYLSKPT